MKKTTLFLFLLIFSTGFAQSDEEIASVYIKKAEKAFKIKNIDLAEKNFNKAVKLLDTIKNEGFDRLGTMISYKQGDLTTAKKYAKHYFKIAKDKSSDKYSEQLNLYVTIQEKLDSIEMVNFKLAQAKLAYEQELKRIDSLKTVWNQKSTALNFMADEVNTLDKNGLTVYKKGAFYGIVNDLGKIIIKANKYKDYRNFDGYILLLNHKTEPTSIMCFNAATLKNYLLPNVTQFNALSTHYGTVMQPRGNHKLVCYPNNSLKTLVFDLQKQNFETISDKKTLFKQLKRAKKIDYYNKKGQVKINKQWYHFGGAIGTGIYTLYSEDYSLYGFFFQLEGNIVPKSQFPYLGSLYKNKIEVLKANNSDWINGNYQEVEAPENESGKYKGTTKIMMVDTGKFQFQQTIHNKTIIILKDEKLDLLEDFLIKNNLAPTDL